jgi:hypothetical protein
MRVNRRDELELFSRQTSYGIGPLAGQFQTVASHLNLPGSSR